jgi:Zn-finger nucleic acid-binding protein
MADTQLKKGIYNCPNCGAAATPQSVRCAYCRSSLATLVCSKCYGAIFLGMKHCPWCGESAAAGKPTEATKGKCPRCDVEFLLIQASKKALSECPSCGGLWVDHDTLQEICVDREEQEAVMRFHTETAPIGEATSLPSEATSPQKRVYIPCPRCSKLMNRRQFAGCSRVVVDYCKAHGTWFDRDELRQIVQFILDGGLAKAREREKLQLEQERQNLRDERRNLERLSKLGSQADFADARQGYEVDLLSVMGGIWDSIKNGK